MEDRNAKELHEEEHFLQNEGEASLQMEEEGSELTPTDRVLYTVTAPKRAFAGLLNTKLGGVIGISLGVAILLSLITSFMMFGSDEYIGNLKEMQAERFEEMLDDPGLTSSEREAIEEQQEAVESVSDAQYMFGGLISAVLGVPIIALLVGLLVFIVAKVIEEGRESRVGFVHGFAVASLAGIISAVGGLIQFGLIRITGNPNLQLGPAALVDIDSPVLGAVLGVFSLPYIWWLVVIGIGTATIARSSIAKATLILLAAVVAIAALLGFLAGTFGAMFGA